jgi:hypothetical protein
MITTLLRSGRKRTINNLLVIASDRNHLFRLPRVEGQECRRFSARSLPQ